MDVRVMREATALKEARFVVTIVDVERDHTLPAEEEISGLCVKHIRMPDWFIPTHFKPWFLVKMARMLFLSVSRLLQTPADIYHAHDDTALLACYFAARLRGKPLVFDAHELPLFQSPLSALSRRQRLFHQLSRSLLTYIVPKCVGVITVSPPIVHQLALHYRASAVTVVRNVPPYQTVAKSDALRQHLGLDPSVQLALYQGALHLSRGLVEMIRAAAFFAPDIVLVLMGNGSPETLLQLEALIASEGVAERVKIIPAVSYQELLSWTASADIGLIVYSPDYSLNVRLCLPNKLFEYLMAGLPVLASQLDAVSAVLTAHDCGQVVSSLAPAAIALAVNNMLEKRDALIQMRHNALRAAREEFLWEKESQKLVQLYSEITRPLLLSNGK